MGDMNGDDSFWGILRAAVPKNFRIVIVKIEIFMKVVGFPLLSYRNFVAINCGGKRTT